MPIEIIDKLKQKNNGTFKIVDAVDVAYDDTIDVKTKIDQISTDNISYIDDAIDNVKQYADSLVIANDGSTTDLILKKIKIKDVVYTIPEVSTNIFNFKGSCTYDELISKADAKVGDVWNVTDKYGMNYVCIIADTPGPDSWDALGESIDVSSLQEKLVSGTNIKTINGESILGSGDLVINTEIPFATNTSIGGIKANARDNPDIQNIEAVIDQDTGFLYIPANTNGITYADADGGIGPINNSQIVQANPSDATDLYLTKIKIGATTYNIGTGISTLMASRASLMSINAIQTASQTVSPVLYEYSSGYFSDNENKTRIKIYDEINKCFISYLFYTLTIMCYDKTIDASSTYEISYLMPIDVMKMTEEKKYIPFGNLFIGEMTLTPTYSGASAYLNLSLSFSSSTMQITTYAFNYKTYSVKF